MKRFFFFLMVLSLCTGPALRAQDAAMEERVNKLNGLVQDLLEDKANQKKQIESLSKEIQELREQAAKPSGNYASQDDLRALAKKLQEIDDKRVADNERILNAIEKLAKTSTATKPKQKAAPTDTAGTTGGDAQKGFEHTIASGDTLSTIAQAYREQGIKVTADQIQKANPSLVAEKMKVGQKIFIPAPPK